MRHMLNLMENYLNVNKDIIYQIVIRECPAWNICLYVLSVMAVKAIWCLWKHRRERDRFFSPRFLFPTEVRISRECDCFSLGRAMNFLKHKMMISAANLAVNLLICQYKFWRFFSGKLLFFPFYSCQFATTPDMIFVKTFTLADFGPVIFYPKACNLLQSWSVASLGFVIKVLHA